ncbi:unnamed protein product [Prunus armeniaca]
MRDEIYFLNFCVKRHFCPCQVGLVHAMSSFLTEKLTELTERTISENGGIIKSISSAAQARGERLPEAARDSSSAGPVARFGGGSHVPEQAQGQVLPGLKPELADVSAGISAQ